MKLIPSPFKTHEEYQSYILDCEKAQYAHHEELGHFCIDVNTTQGWIYSIHWTDYGLRRITYKGFDTRQYGTVMFNIKGLEDCGYELETADYCYRCDSPDWEMGDDEVTSAYWYPGYNQETGEREVRYTRFDEDFAAKESHP